MSELRLFSSSDAPPSVDLRIQHEVDWGRDAETGEYEFYYNFLDYRFHRDGVELVGRMYLDRVGEVGLRGPMRLANGEPVMVEDEHLVQAAVRYFVDRDVKDIKRLSREGYVPVDAGSMLDGVQ